MNKEIDVNKVVNSLRSKISDLEYEVMLKNIYIEELIEELESATNKDKKEEGKTNV